MCKQTVKQEYDLFYLSEKIRKHEMSVKEKKKTLETLEDLLDWLAIRKEKFT